ncbi:MAG: hypothetical protein IT269_00305 [Saprospiraceae bacterium]|nr:hypothetical protein [Saprospiraceae bacterium]
MLDITKYINGQKQLSPCQLIAADVNKSNSVTTFDIVALRKLLLGEIQGFLYNTSWRFVDANFNFPNPNNPFGGIPSFTDHEFISGIDITDHTPDIADFIAIKIGDVNNSAMRPAEPLTSTLSWPDLKPGRQSVITVPIRYTGNDPLIAFQSGFHFDRERLEYLGFLPADLPAFSPDNFGLTDLAAGNIRCLWTPPPSQMEDLNITPGATLFYLVFKVKSSTTNADTQPYLRMDEAVMPALAWRADGQEYALHPELDETTQGRHFTTTDKSVTATAQPNPTAGPWTMTFKCEKACAARWMLFDPKGQRVRFQSLQLTGGEQTLNMPNLSDLPNAVYTWRLFTDNAELQGFVVKQ